MTAIRHGFQLGYYGDDFSGSADVMEVLAQAGLRTRLYLNTDAAQQASPEAWDAIGIAGVSRSLPTERLADELHRPLTWLWNACQIVHYKTCSTFDSSPQIGSIGRVIDLAREWMDTQQVPIVVGAPALGRYCVFGNLFARSGAASPVFRLDRHPTMSCHPITPMREADLVRHLSQQTTARVVNVNVLQLAQWQSTECVGLPPDADAVLFDTLDERHLYTIGHHLHHRASEGKRCFVVGSSGVEYALTTYWQREQRTLPPSTQATIPPVDALLVVSGSCSPVTARQIDDAVRHGFVDLPLAASDWTDLSRRHWIDQAVSCLRQGQSVVVHAARGPDDPRIAQVEAELSATGLMAERNRRLGQLFGHVIQRTLEETNVRRVAVAGGDTAGYVAKSLDIHALEFIAPLAPGSPLCAAQTSARRFELTFKGGQVGGDDFFRRVKGD